MYYEYFGFDWTYLIIIIGFLLTLAASWQVNHTFAKYDKMRSMCGLTGAQAAQKVLQSAGITDVRIEHISGKLTDHYDPRSRTLRLSNSTYGSKSVAAVCVAAHECGHAVQDQVHYRPLILRGTLVPVANFGSSLSWPLFFIGLVFYIPVLTSVGILLFSLAVIFQLITLPVEFNASSRALRILDQTHLLGDEELSAGRKVLGAAAMTYVASLASSILQLIRLILLAGGRSGGRRRR